VERQRVDKLKDESHLRAELSKAQAANQSLLTELWEGVRAHGLTAPKRGTDSERLIHAYCGGIVRTNQKLDEVSKALRKLRDAVATVAANPENTKAWDWEGLRKDADRALST